MKALLSIVCSVVWMASAQLVQAESAATAAVRIDSITLTDLAPDDGVLPTFDIRNITVYGSANAVNTPLPDPFDLNVIRTRTSLVPLSVIAPVPEGFDIRASGQFSGGTLGTLQSDVAVGLDGRATVYSEVKYDFALSPHTSATFVGSLSGYAALVGQQAGANEQLSSTEARFLVFGDLIPQRGVQFVLPVQLFPSGSDYSFRELRDSLDINFTVTNNTDSVQVSQYWIFVNSHARNSAMVALIPEPHEYMTLLAGLALVGARAKRQKPAQE